MDVMSPAVMGLPVYSVNNERSIHPLLGSITTKLLLYLYCIYTSVSTYTDIPPNSLPDDDEHDDDYTKTNKEIKRVFSILINDYSIFYE